jgi:hypothetical protein
MMYESVIKAVVESGAWKGTKYLSEKEVVRVTRPLYSKGFSRRALEVVLTHGKPNYLEREFIKKCKTAGEPLPVKKVQLKFRRT